MFVGMYKTKCFSNNALTMLDALGCFLFYLAKKKERQLSLSKLSSQLTE